MTAISRPSEIERPVAGGEPAPVPEYVSDLVVEVLRGLSVRYLPINPGSSFRGLHDSIVNYGRNVSPQLLLCVHEEIAVAMAHAYAKATRGVGVAAVHDLVGLMHASMAVYNAWCDGVPLLLLGGGGPSNSSIRRGIDWVHSASAQASLVREFVKWDDEPADAEALLNAIARGHALAASAPAGPVYVTLDMDLQENPVPEHGVAAPALDRCLPVRVAAPASDVERALDLIVAAAQPVVVAGNLGYDPDATAPLVEFVELISAAYRDDDNAVAFPTNHPLNLSGDHGLLSEGGTDLVIGIGVSNLAEIVAQCGPGTRVVDVSLRHLRYRGWTNAGAAPVAVDAVVAAEPAEGIRQLLAAARVRLAGDSDHRAGGAARRHVVEQRHKELRAEQAATLRDRWDDLPIAPQRMAAEVWHAVRDRDWLLVLRNTRSWLDGIWEFDGAGQWLGHSVGGGVGYGPGAMLGGALAARDRGQLPVAIIGDGDLHMGVGALWTAVHYEIPLLVVVNNNRSFYNDEQHQRRVAQRRDRPVANAWIGMRMADPEVDFTVLARGYGAWADAPITVSDQLGPALRSAIEQVEAGRVALLDVRTASE